MVRIQAESKFSTRLSFERNSSDVSRFMFWFRSSAEFCRIRLRKRRSGFLRFFKTLTWSCCCLKLVCCAIVNSLTALHSMELLGNLFWQQNSVLIKMFCTTFGILFKTTFASLLCNVYSWIMHKTLSSDYLELFLIFEIEVLFLVIKQSPKTTLIV